MRGRLHARFNRYSYIISVAMQELIESNGQRIGPRKLVICNWLPVLFGYHLTAPLPHISQDILDACVQFLQASKVNRQRILPVGVWGMPLPFFPCNNKLTS